jgi:hypothetical protein
MRQVLQGNLESQALFDLQHRSQAFLFLPLGRIGMDGVDNPWLSRDLHV